MITLTTMTLVELLNKKFLEWQYQSGSRKTVEEFGNLFGAKKALISAWMNGTRQPGSEYKEKIIELYGNEAIEAFGEDPDLYAIQQNWEYLTPEERRLHREAVEQQATQNEAKRSHKTRRTTAY